MKGEGDAMCPVEPEMEALMDAFLFESNGMLEQLDDILLESERSGGISEENINSIFRITHTIKGSAAMMGFGGVSSLAHAVEDVFYILRETPSKLGMVFDVLFDLVFQTSDFLKRELERMSEAGYTEADPADLIAQLEEQALCMKGETSGAEAGPDSAPAPAPEAQPASGLKDNVVRIRVFFEEGCQMENMRAYMLLTQLKGVCAELDSIPHNPEADSANSAEIVKNGFVVLCKPREAVEEVLKVIENSLNIHTYELLGEMPAVHAATEPGATAAAVEESQTAATRAGKQSFISVNQTKLDHLMDLVGELVTGESIVASSPDLKGLKLDTFSKSVRELRKLTDELQDVVMSIRMVPLHGTYQKMERIVRDMCRKLDKHVELVTNGGDTEVDKTIIDAISDPLMHMIRNAVDHAIESKEERIALGKPETGRVTLSARNVGGEILIDIADDGQGLDAAALIDKAKRSGILAKPESEYSEKEAFQLIMLPGFSTNSAVTEYSGRGVGMDVVRKNVERVGGSVAIASELGKGTTFTVKIPLTLAIVDGMNLAVGETVFTLPITSIRQSFKVADPAQIIRDTEGREMILIRGECLPVIRLQEIFGLTDRRGDITDGILIQAEGAGAGACLFADELLGEYQVVVKPFPAFLSQYGLKDKGLSGCSILGDGTISLILDPGNLIGG